MKLKPLLNLASDRLAALPLLVVYITDGCNSRCVTCDIWKLPRRNMSLDLVRRLAAEFPALGVRSVLLSGGEAMQHSDWPTIAQTFRQAGAQVNLLTNALLLKKQAAQVIDSVDSLTVSLDGATPETYHAIRGVDALPLLLEGISAVSAHLPVTTRTTIQQLNFREMPQIVDVAKAAGVRQVSFLAVDVRSAEAFGPRFTGDPSVLPVQPVHAPPGPALREEDLPEFAATLDQLEHTHAADFQSGRIAESPAKLRRLHGYFMALHGLAPFDPPRCNAPHVSTVIEVDGTIRPCYFLPAGGRLGERSLGEALNDSTLVALRQAYRTGQRRECEACVCPLYRGPRALLR